MTAEQIIDYLSNHSIELFATITSLIYLYFSIRGHILLWLFGIISSLIYVYICFKARIYADMSINAYYVIISIYGWIHWSLKQGSKKKELPISRLKISQSTLLLITTIILFFIIGYVLNHYTDSDVAWWDSFTTALSITATWMLARKILEHWILWIIVDGVSVGLYIYKQLDITVVLFVVYTIMAVIGFYEWKKQWKTELTAS